MALINCQTAGCRANVDTEVVQPENGHYYRCQRCGNLSPWIAEGGEHADAEAVRNTKVIYCRCPDCGKGFNFNVGMLGIHPAELSQVQVECGCIRARATGRIRERWMPQPFDYETGKQPDPVLVTDEEMAGHLRQWTALDLITNHTVESRAYRPPAKMGLFSRG